MSKPQSAIQRFRAKRKASQLWYTPEQHDLVRRAARLDHRPMTTFAILAAVKAARELLARSK